MSTVSHSRITQDQLEAIKESYKYWQWFESESGKREFTTDELKRLVACEKHMKESIPLLLGVIERLKFIARQNNPHMREG